MDDNNNNNSNVDVYGAVTVTTAIMRVHRVHLMNADSAPSTDRYQNYSLLLGDKNASIGVSHEGGDGG